MPTRFATLADIPALVALINAAYAVEAFLIRGERTSTDELTGLLEAPTGHLLVLDAPDGLRPAGTVHVDIHGDRGHFALLAVDPRDKGQGLGRRLIAEVERYCRERHCSVLELDVFEQRTELPPFYASCGFHHAGVQPFARQDLLRRPATLLRMTKEL